MIRRKQTCRNPYFRQNESLYQSHTVFFITLIWIYARNRTPTCSAGLAGLKTMRKILFLLLNPFLMYGQGYTSYFTGNQTDKIASPAGGVCLMGGATEDDNAMRWFLQRAGGGDVLVLRASGADGYNEYMYTTPGVSLNSVETIVCSSAAASNSPYVLQKIRQAEAIWFAGGDQWKYISYWQNTAVDSLVNQAVKERNIVIGGTSAGMAIQGGYRFSARNGTVTSAAALANPFDSKVTIDSSLFLENRFLSNVITDTHFDNPDRRGRLAVFLARIFNDYGKEARAIACDEYTAVCIDTSGTARVFGGAPLYDDHAWFIQINCEISEPAPESCTPGQPLTWNQSGKALKVFRITGDPSGTSTFNLNDWKTGTAGSWYDWGSNQGILSSVSGSVPECIVFSGEASETGIFSIYPNPAGDYLTIRMNNNGSREINLSFHDLHGRLISRTRLSGDEVQVDTGFLEPGIYILGITAGSRSIHTKIIKHP